MPRPLHEPDIRNPTKIQIHIATPVGADLRVGPVRTSGFHPQAHTQVRPYKVGRGSLIDHTSEPGGPPPTGGLITQEQTPEYPTPRSGSAAATGRPRSGPAAGTARPGCRGTAPADHKSEPGHLYVPRQSDMQFETPACPPAKRPGSGHWPPGVQGHCPCLT